MKVTNTQICVVDENQSEKFNRKTFLIQIFSELRKYVEIEKKIEILEFSIG